MEEFVLKEVELACFVLLVSTAETTRALYSRRFVRKVTTVRSVQTLRTDANQVQFALKDHRVKHKEVKLQATASPAST